MPTKSNVGMRSILGAAMIAGSSFALLIACSCGDPEDENGNGNGGGEGAQLFVAAALPSGVAGADFGRHASVAIGPEGLPIAAFTWSRTGDESLRFSKWQGGGWAESVEVHAMSPVNSNQPFRQVAIAYDATDDVIGIAHVSGQHEIRLALSTDRGSTWSSEIVNEIDAGNPRTVANPALAMGGSEIHLAYWQARQRGGTAQSDGIWYLKRSGGDELVRELTALLPGTIDNSSRPMGLALDSQGRAGLAYFLRADSNVQARDNVSLAFWRPDQAAASLVTDSSGSTYDNASVSLGFDGTRPVVSFHHRMGDQQEFLFFSTSENGVEWTTPATPPRDGEDRTGVYQSGAVAPDGRIAVAAMVDQVTSGSRGAHGSPKVLVRSGSSWSISSPLAAPSATRGIRHLDMVFDAQGTMHLLFQNESVDSAPLGVLHWRVPPPEED